MVEYIRFGEIPKDEKSINWWKVSLDDQADFSWELERYGYEEAVKCISKKCFENGVSVFEIGEDGNPILKNENLEKAYNSYTKDGRKAYIVTGNKVGNGADEEPVIKNVKILKEYNYK